MTHWPSLWTPKSILFQGRQILPDETNSVIAEPDIYLGANLLG
jgi:hypothetical protein